MGPEVQVACLPDDPRCQETSGGAHTTLGTALEGTFVSTARPPGGRKIQGRGLPRPELMVSASGTRIPRVLRAAARDPDPPPSKDQGLARAVLPATPASAP